MSTRKALLVTTGDLKAMIVPLFLALLKTFGRLKEDKVFEIARTTRRKRAVQADLFDSQNVGKE